MPEQRAVDILLLDLPVALWADTRERTDALIDGLAPAAAADPEGPAARIRDIVARLRRAADVSEASELELRAAAARRTKQIDVAYAVPVGSRDDLAALCRAYDEAEEYCRTNGLEHLVAPPETAAFRHWFIGQLVTQLDGGFPTAWPA